MEIEQIAKELWKNLDFYIKMDRTPPPYDFNHSNPGILRLVKKTIYKPNFREVALTYDVSVREEGGQFIPGKIFEDSSITKFCQSFINSNKDVVTKFKNAFREIKHPYYSNELQDEIAVSVLVYRYTERHLSALRKDVKIEWSNKDKKFLKRLLHEAVKLTAYAGITNIIPNTFEEKTRLNHELKLKCNDKGARTVFRRPQLYDFPEYFVAGDGEGDNEIPSNISQPNLPPTYLYIYSERDSSTIPIRFHHQTEDRIFSNTLGFYSQMDAFEKSFGPLYSELEKSLEFLRLIQSQTIPDLSFWGYSVFVGGEKIYDEFIPKKSNPGPSHRSYEWNLKTDKNRKTTESFLNLIFKRDVFHRLIEKEDTEGVEVRLRGCYERYNEIVESNHSAVENINDAVVTLEKFYSERKDQGKKETLTGLANLVKCIFDDDKYIYKIFEIGYCLRNMYSHHEVTDGNIKKCITKMVRYENGEDITVYRFYLSYLQNSLVELLRFTVIGALVSNLNSQDFSKELRTEESPKEVLPLSLSKFFHGEHYVDNYLKYVIDYYICTKE